MLPATKSLRKEMLPVAGKPLLQYSVEEAAASGIETVVLVTSERSASVLEHFQRNLALEEHLQRRGQYKEAELIRSLAELVTFCKVEQPSPRGLGDAVYCARGLVRDEPFVLLLPDVIIDAQRPCSAQLIDAYSRHAGSVIAVRWIDPSELSRYGIVAPADGLDLQKDACFRIAALVEKPPLSEAPSLHGICGRYLLEPTVFEYIEQEFSDTRAEIQITGALNRLAKSQPVHALQFEGQIFDAGDPLGFLKANIALALKDEDLHSELRAFLERTLQTTAKN